MDLGVAPFGKVADFLISLFDKGLAFTTIMGYGTAIVTVHKGFPDGSSVSSLNILSKLAKSMIINDFHQ